MATQQFSKIFIVGGTGAQGLPIVRNLVQDGKYKCRVLTRDTTSKRSQSLAALGSNIELFEGSFMDEGALRNGYHDCDAAFVNIDGFNTGEQGETYWATRSYELAVEDGGIRFFVYGNLDFIYKKSGYNPDFRTGHYDGKGRIGEWILSQGAMAMKKEPNPHMGVALFTTGPYIEMIIAPGTPMTPVIERDTQGRGVVTWKVPLTEDGAIAHVALEDCGPYVRWLFDNPDRANGLDLEVAIEHVHYSDLAKAFANVTGHPAKFEDIDFDTYWRKGPLSQRADYSAGYATDISDPAAISIKDNFTGFWTMWRHSGYNKGAIRRNYALLDEIHPHRIRTAEEWLRIEDEKGRKSGKGSLWDRVQPENLTPILKLHEDGFQRPIPP